MFRRKKGTLHDEVFTDIDSRMNPVASVHSSVVPSGGSQGSSGTVLGSSKKVTKFGSFPIAPSSSDRGMGKLKELMKNSFRSNETC